MTCCACNLEEGGSSPAAAPSPSTDSPQAVQPSTSGRRLLAAGQCNSVYHTVEQNLTECVAVCEVKQENAPGSTIDPVTYTKSGVDGVCCNCRMVKPASPPPPPSPSDRTSSGADGAYVFLAATTYTTVRAASLNSTIYSILNNGTLLSALSQREWGTRVCAVGVRRTPDPQHPALPPAACEGGVSGGWEECGVGDGDGRSVAWEMGVEKAGRNRERELGGRACERRCGSRGDGRDSAGWGACLHMPSTANAPPTTCNAAGVSVSQLYLMFSGTGDMANMAEPYVLGSPPPPPSDDSPPPPPPATSPPPPPGDDAGSGLSTASIVGITIGAVAATACVILVIVALCYSRRRKAQAQQQKLQPGNTGGGFLKGACQEVESGRDLRVQRGFLPCFPLQRVACRVPDQTEALGRGCEPNFAMHASRCHLAKNPCPPPMPLARSAQGACPRTGTRLPAPPPCRTQSASPGSNPGRSWKPTEKRRCRRTPPWRASTWRAGAAAAAWPACPAA